MFDTERADRALVLFSFLILLAPPAAGMATSIPVNAVPVVAEGNSVPGVGLVEAVDYLAINDYGHWLVSVRTDNPDFNKDTAILKDGLLLFQEGQSMTAPPFAKLGTVWSLDLDNSGTTCQRVYLKGVPQESAVYRDATLVVLEGQVSTSPAFTPGTPYTHVAGALVNDANQMLLLAFMDDANIPGDPDYAVIRLDLAASGAILAETVVLKEGDPAPAVPNKTIGKVITNGGTYAINDVGEAVTMVELAPSGGGFGPIAIYRDHTLLALDGTPSPVPGRNWDFLSSERVDINNQGQVAFRGRLSGSEIGNEAVFVDDRLLVQKGDMLADIAPFYITTFQFSPVCISDCGDVLWFGLWSDSNFNQNGGLFLNHRLLLQEGVSKIGGKTIRYVGGPNRVYDMSDNGRYVLLEVWFTDLSQAAVLIDLGPWQGLGGTLAGSGGEPRMFAVGPLTGGALCSLSVHGARENAPGVLVAGFSNFSVPFAGTTLVPYPSLIEFGADSDSFGEIHLAGVWGLGVPAGVTAYSQLFIVDPLAPQGFAATNAVLGITP